jgi:YozE SAM-like fold
MANKLTAADVMSREPRGSFRSWLVSQIHRDDAVGDLATHIREDACLGQNRTPSSILSHLQASHDIELHTFDRALNEWQPYEDSYFGTEGDCYQRDDELITMIERVFAD